MRNLLSSSRSTRQLESGKIKSPTFSLEEEGVFGKSSCNIMISNATNSAVAEMGGGYWLRSTAPKERAGWVLRQTRWVRFDTQIVGSLVGVWSGWGYGTFIFLGSDFSKFGAWKCVNIALSAEFHPAKFWHWKIYFGLWKWTFHMSPIHTSAMRQPTEFLPKRWVRAKRLAGLGVWNCALGNRIQPVSAYLLWEKSKVPPFWGPPFF